jgi:putative ABC transport system permease protein
MHFLPILSTLRRHRTTAALIVLEIALTCAIVSNAIFLIRGRLARMDADSGITEDELVRVVITGIKKNADARAVTAQDLVALRAIPGVKSVAAANQIPFGGGGWSSDVSTIHDDPAPPLNAAMYMGSPDLLETLGTKLIAGRDFTPEEYVDVDDVQTGKAHIPSVILTRAVADRLFPGKIALGQALYIWGREPHVVVGVIEQLARTNEGNGPDASGADQSAYSIVVPVTTPYSSGHQYLLRVEPERRAEVLAAVDAPLNKVDPSRILLEHQTFADVRREYFRQDRAMAWLLIGVSLGLLIITALGIVGLASFWVQQRTRQIGIRRALGATRGDILRYFQLENLILATLGIALGMALAYALNLLLMSKYQVERLPAELLPIGAVLLWLLGQISVLGPALRAATIPPAVATRTV